MNTVPISFSTRFALSSFILGSIFFALLKLHPSYYMVIIAAIYTILAIVFNAILLLQLVYQLIFFSAKEETFIKILILLSNIPIAYLYCTLLLN